MKYFEIIKKSLSKKVQLVISLMAVIAIIMVVITFYNEKTMTKRYANMVYNVVLEKKAGNPWDNTEFFIRNKEKNNRNVVLRVNYNEIWSKEENEEIYTLDNNINGENVVDKTWTLEFISGFREYKDGWYYYDQILKPQESIRILRKLKLKEDLINASPYKNDYLEYDYDLIFNYEVIDADEDLIKDIWGRDVKFEKNRVLWKS